MKNKATIITTIIFAAATVGLTISTVLLAVNSGNQAEEIKALATENKIHKNELEEKTERINLVGMATCLMEAYETTSTVRNASCESIVKFITSEKTNADIKEWLGE